MTPLENFRLTAFRAVAEQLSFRKAAEKLYVTQPAVSLQIKSLEEQLGVVLFSRSGPGVHLTPAGEVLLKYSIASNRLLSEAIHSLSAFSGTQSGALMLGASTTIAQYVLPALLSEFCISHPRVRPRLTSGNTEHIVKYLEDEKIALGFIEGPPRSRAVVASAFLRDELILLVPAAHEWAERGEVMPKELTEVHMLMRERGSGTRDIVELVLGQHHIRRSSLKIMMELDSTEGIKSAVEAGLGVGFVSRWAIAKDVRLGPAFRIVKIKGIHIRRNFLMISPKGPELADATAEFRDFVLSRCSVEK